MSYDLRILARERLDPARAEALLRAGGAKGAGEELWIEREGVVGSVLLDLKEIDVGVTTVAEGDPGEGFASLLDLVLDVADELGALVEDPQIGGELTRARREDALAAFGES